MFMPSACHVSLPEDGVIFEQRLLYTPSDLSTYSIAGHPSMTDPKRNASAIARTIKDTIRSVLRDLSSPFLSCAFMAVNCLINSYLNDVENSLPDIIYMEVDI